MRVVEITKGAPEPFILEHFRALARQMKENIHLLTPGYINLHNKTNQISSLLSEHTLSLKDRLERKIRRKELNEFLLEKNLNQLYKFKPDLLHFHFGWSAIKFFPVIKKSGLPFSISLRGSDIMVLGKEDNAFNTKLKEVIQNASGIHVVSENVKDELTGSYKFHCPVKLIRTPIDKRWLSEIRIKKKPNILSIGRLHWVKDYQELIFAFKAAKLPEASLTIIGNGEEYEKLSLLTRHLLLTNNVKLKGRQEFPEIKNSLNKSRLFVITSISEGFPNVLAEAIFAGVPCLVPDHLNIQKVFTEEEIFFYSKFEKKNLAVMLEKALNASDSNLEMMAQKAQKKAITLFDLENHGREFVSFFQEAIAYSKLREKR